MRALDWLIDYILYDSSKMKSFSGAAQKKSSSWAFGAVSQPFYTLIGQKSKPVIGM